MEPVELSDGVVLLRPWRPEDADAVYAACQDAEVQRWTTVPRPYRRADAETFVGRISPAGWAEGSAAIFGVFRRDGGGLVGAMGLDHLHDVGSAWGGRGELGFWTAAPARRQGLTTRAARLLCQWGLAELGLGRIDWWAVVGNVGSREVAQRVGFRLEGTARAALVHRGVRMDGWVGGLLPGDLTPGDQTPGEPVGGRP